MKKAEVYKVVIMENVATSSTVWTQFIKAERYTDIVKYVANSDCKIVYSTSLDEVDAQYTDKPIDELVNGEMIYNS